MKNDCIITSNTQVQKSWRDISEGIKNGSVIMKIGDIVTCNLPHGRIADFIVTDITNEYVRFESKDCIGDCISHSYTIDYLNSILWNILPEELQNVISTVKRKGIKDGNEFEYECKLFIPSASEVFEDDMCKGDKGLYKQLEWYKDRRHRMKGQNREEDTDYWWLSSTASEYLNPRASCAVDCYGNPYLANWVNSLHVSVCFHISKTYSEDNKYIKETI